MPYDDTHSVRTLDAHDPTSTETHSRDDSRLYTSSRNSSTAPPSSSSTFSNYHFQIPRPLKTLFDSCPLITYPPNGLSLYIAPPFDQDANQQHHHILYIFTTAVGAATGEPSYNPSCLKWQTLLKFHGVPFVTRQSNNHAAPGGALPFLLTYPGFTSAAPSHTSLKSTSTSSSTTSPSAQQAISSSKLPTWLQTHYPFPPRDSSKSSLNCNSLSDTYPSLLTPLRHAYTHSLYLHDPTFRSLATPLYITPCSRTTLVRHLLTGPLRAAALDQLVLGSAGTGGSGVGVRIDVEGLYGGAEEAPEALSFILGRRKWFGEGGNGKDEDEEETGKGDQEEEEDERPGMLDAAVFAYTHVILEYFARQQDGTPARRLFGIVNERKNLVQHRDRVLREYYGR